MTRNENDYLYHKYHAIISEQEIALKNDITKIVKEMNDEQNSNKKE